MRGGKTGGTAKMTMIASTPEHSEIARTLASLALAKARQDGVLRIRQREQLRRAFAKAAGSYHWDAIPGTRPEQVDAATRDLTELTDVGAELLERDLVELLTCKKGEITQIEEVAKSIHEMADDATVAYPTDVEYSHTMRSAMGDLVTKTVTLTLANANEAVNAAAALEKRLDGLAKLRDQMLADLKDKQRQVRAMRQGLGDFVESFRGLLAELLAIST